MTTSYLSLYPSSLFFFEVLSYTVSIIAVRNQYLKTKYKPYLMIITGFGLTIITSALRYAITFTSNPNLAKTVFSYINLILLTAITFWIIGFIYFRYETPSFYLLLIVYFGGISAGAYAFATQIKIFKDQTSHNWNASYPLSFSLLIGPLVFIAFKEFIHPVYIKYKMVHSNRGKQTLLTMLLGMIFVIIWGVSSLFTQNTLIRITRPFLLPLGWLIWSIALTRMPLILGFSKAQPLILLVSNKRSGAFLFIHYFTKETKFKYNEVLITSLLTALNHATQEVLGEKSNVNLYNIGEKIVLQKTLEKNELNIFLITKNYDQTLVAALNYFSYLLENTNLQKSYQEINLENQVKQAFGPIIIN